MDTNENHRDVGKAIRRGLKGRCPHCGKGDLFAGYLAIVQKCSVCSTLLGRYRAADGPAFVTITIVGLLLIPVLGWGYADFRPNPVVLAIVVTILLTLLTLVILRLAKGAIVGYLWATDEIDDGA